MGINKNALKPTVPESANHPIKLSINRDGEHGSETANSAMLVITWLTVKLRSEIAKLGLTRIGVQILESPLPAKPSLPSWKLEPYQHDGLIATISLPDSEATRPEIAKTVITQVVELLTTCDVNNWPVLVRRYKDRNAQALKDYWSNDLFFSFLMDEDIFDLEEVIREDHRLCSASYGRNSMHDGTIVICAFGITVKIYTQLLRRALTPGVTTPCPTSAGQGGINVQPAQTG